MNILITTDDGINSVGLQVLRDAVATFAKGASPVIIATPEQVSGAGMAVTSRWLDPVEQSGVDTYVLDATPTDIIYRAFRQPEEFTKRPWDLVLVGCNAGANLGFDIWHSGTVGAAMSAAKGHGCCAMAFSQDLPSELQALSDWSGSSRVTRKHFTAADKIIPHFLRTHGPDAGACWNVNIPEEATLGLKSAALAHYSYMRTPPTSVVPRAKNDGSDVDLLLQGYVTVSQLDPRAEPMMKY